MASLAAVTNSTAFSILHRLDSMMNRMKRRGRWTSGGSTRSSVTEDSDDDGGLWNSSMDSLPWVVETSLVSEEEATVMLAEKGSLLSRVGLLEERAVKLEEKMKKEKAWKQIILRLEKKRHVQEPKKKSCTPCVELWDANKQSFLRWRSMVSHTKLDEEEEKEKRSSLLRRILLSGFHLSDNCFTPTRKEKSRERSKEQKKQKIANRQVKSGAIRIPGKQLKGDEESTDVIKQKLPLSEDKKRNQAKGSTDLVTDYDRMFSLQGIQSFATWELQHARPLEGADDWI